MNLRKWCDRFCSYINNLGKIASGYILFNLNCFICDDIKNKKHILVSVSTMVCKILLLIVLAVTLCDVVLSDCPPGTYQGVTGCIPYKGKIYLTINNWPMGNALCSIHVVHFLVKRRHWILGCGSSNFITVSQLQFAISNFTKNRVLYAIFCSRNGAAL